MGSASEFAAYILVCLYVGWVGISVCMCRIVTACACQVVSWAAPSPGSYAPLPTLWQLGGSPWTVVLLGPLDTGCLWRSVVPISSVSASGPGWQVCGSSHPLLIILMEKPYLHKRAHT
ncbi:hypothetical protein AMECASPLE_036020 [Ameca splendens]|uniref:Secreted protein n=1 Tax=Ameca splendens TaxID=208324 RepID=A0ABV0XWL5_9TELE